MLTLRLYPADFAALISFLRICTKNQQALALAQQSVGILVLLEYGRAWKPERLFRWSQKRPDRQHTLKLPLPVAKVLHTELQQYWLSPEHQTLLNTLDLAIVNYQSPYAQPHALGELVRLPGLLNA